MAKKWMLSRKGADFEKIAEKYNISPYLARIMRNRNVITDEEIEMYLNGTPDMLHSPGLLKDIDVAAQIIRDAIDALVPIRVVGDYDIDGICASFILKTGLEYLGANVDVYLPDRVRDGYGLNEEIIRKAAEDGIELIVTCDNGIAAVNEIELAVNLGMTVIVTDHHEVPYIEENGSRRFVLPPADAIIDPKQEDCGYPFDGICGAMVAYKLISYMLSEDSYSDKEQLMDELMSFAAFATVGDVMQLTDENRIAVKYGLELLKNTTNIGMRSLINVTGIDVNKLSAYHIGFVLGPCINATGRLDTASRALKLFESVSVEEANVIAQELYDLNESRKNITASFVDEALDIVNSDYKDDTVLVVFLPECHESIAGIVASRLKEHFYKPTIVLTNTTDGLVKGSGRSIDAYDMFEELTKVKDLFVKFGGHKMAAGVSLVPENVDELRRQLNRNSKLTEADIIEKLVIDIPLPIGYVSKKLVKELERLAPYGVGNPQPLFAQKDIPVKSVLLMGKNKDVMKMNLLAKGEDGQVRTMEAIAFHVDEETYETASRAATISIVYQPSIKEYMGVESIQLIIKDIDK